MDINTTFDQFAAQYEALGRVGDPGLVTGGETDAAHQYQCVSLIKKYLPVFGVTPGLWGNAIDYWKQPKAKNGMSGKFTPIPTQEPQKGDIVVLDIDHIGISNGVVQGTTFQILDQNGGVGTGTGTGADAIQLHTFKKTHILGVFRPAVPAASAPPPAPAAPRFSVVETYPNGKLISLNKQPTYLWGMNYAFEYMCNNPIETHNQGEVWTVTNKVHHEDGYDYYRRDGQIDGFNVLDCDDYTPPPPPAPTPPAAPIEVKMAERYPLVCDMPFYGNALDAGSGTNVLGTLKVGTYIVFSKEDKKYNLTDDNTKDRNQWVNTIYNVPAPAKPAPAEPVVPPANATDQSWKKTLTPLVQTGKAIRFRVLKDTYLFDMADHSDKGIELKESDPDDKETWIPIKFYLSKNGGVYLVPFLGNDIDSATGKPKDTAHYYCIPTTDIDSGLPALQSELYQADVPSEREYRREQGHSTLEDNLFFAQQKIAKLVNDGVRFLDGIIPIKLKKKK